MSSHHRFSFARLWAMVVKESLQLRRDRMTAAMVFGIPILQILLFGFVINSDPRHLPAAVLMADDGPAGRSLLAGFKNSSYYDFVRVAPTEAEARAWLDRGEVQFVVDLAGHPVTVGQKAGGTPVGKVVTGRHGRFRVRRCGGRHRSGRGVGLAVELGLDGIPHRGGWRDQHRHRVAQRRHRVAQRGQGLGARRAAAHVLGDAGRSRRPWPVQFEPRCSQ